MPVKIMQILKFPVVSRNRQTDIISSTGEKPDVANFPAGRKNQNNNAEATDRNLTSNMTGQVALTGTVFDLHFSKGSLRRIGRNGTVLFDKLNSRTYFTTSSGNIKFRNESAFAFEDNTEYGLRTLQIPEQDRTHEHRIITDFIQNRETNELFFTFTIHYPEFGKDTIIFEAAVCEFRVPFRADTGVVISTDDQSFDDVLINGEQDSSIFIPGSSFMIKASGKNISIRFQGPSDSPDSENGSNISGLSVKSSIHRGNHVLFINPGGSYIPAPAEYYSGISEKFSFRLDISTD